MGKPAARMGDMTVHGGVIVQGLPTVLIGGMPAARVGDMHTCPMVNPGTPPPPHVGGPIMPPGVPTVLIGGQPAACVGDMATCAGPPDTIAPPGCPTVLIGSGGGGGGGGGAGGSGGGGESEGDSGSGGGPAVEDEAEDTEEHFLDVSFTDKGGSPITGVGYTVTSPDGKQTSGLLAGKIRRSGIEPGTYEIKLHAITNACWSVEEAHIGDTVTLSAKTSGIESGTKATFIIYVRDFHSPDRELLTITSEVNNDKVEAQWTTAVDERLLEIQNANIQYGYSSPLYYFVVSAGECEARSRMMKLWDVIEIKLLDEEGNGIGNKKCRVKCPNGEIRESTLDGQGYVKVERVLPGRVEVSFELRDDTTH